MSARLSVRDVRVVANIGIKKTMQITTNNIESKVYCMKLKISQQKFRSDRVVSFGEDSHSQGPLLFYAILFIYGMEKLYYVCPDFTNCCTD